MNAIQLYLTEVAVAAIRSASAGMVRDGDVDPMLVITSMQQLLDGIDHMPDVLVPESPLVYSGGASLSMSVLDPGFKPMFFNPCADGEQG